MKASMEVAKTFDKPHQEVYSQSQFIISQIFRGLAEAIDEATKDYYDG